VYGVIRQSGGSIDVSSRVGEGTIFCISLPVSEAESPPTEKTTAEHDDTSGSETIMTVIEDKTLNDLFTHTLSRTGYTVIPASNAGEALLIFERGDVSVDLLITENIMRYMSGVELAERLTVFSPELKVLYVCGEADGKTSDVRNGMTNKNVLMKPFQPSQLLSRVRALLDEPARTLLS
jgi:DNA-binding NtrC family response regulator